MRRYNTSLKEILSKARKAVSEMNQVAFAILFGSAVRQRRVGDIDIGVVLKERFSIKELLRAWYVLDETLNIPVDIVPLDRAPPLLRYKALTEGIILKDNPKVYDRLLHTAIGELSDIKIKTRQKESPKY